MNTLGNLNELYWKRKPTWRKDLITYNSHPRIMFPFIWCVIIWRRGEGSFEIGCPRSRGWKNFLRSWSRGVEDLKNWTIFMNVICVSSLIIYLCIHGKCSPWDYVTKLRDNQIFKALLRIKKSFRSIGFDLAKHLLVSPPSHPCTGWVNFDWSGNHEIIVYLFIYSYYVFVFVWLSKDTTHWNIHNFHNYQHWKGFIVFIS